MLKEPYVVMTVECPYCRTKHEVRFGSSSISHDNSAPRPKPLRVGDLVLNRGTHDASRAGKEITLNLTEFRMLESLMRHSGRVVSRNALIHLVWDSDGDVNDNLIDVTNYQLRRKVDRDHKVQLIKTVRRLGYSIRDPGKAR